MILPFDLQEKVNSLYIGENKQQLKNTREQLTDKYKNKTGRSVSLINSREDSVLYAISRMPATYSVVYTLVSQLKQQGCLQNIASVLDIGSGTGAGYFAMKELLQDATINLVERDKNMIAVFKHLTDEQVDVERNDIITLETNQKFDLVTASYVLSEMNEDDRLSAVKKMLDLSKDFVLIMDTGTPKTYENMMKIKKYVIGAGFRVLAPCMSEKCGLVDDYCQFFARVERSSLHKLAKDGKLSYEDEKYFYLLISKKQTETVKQIRVIRRPVIKQNLVELKFCSETGVNQALFSKKNKEEYKKAKKIRVNDIF